MTTLAVVRVCPACHGPVDQKGTGGRVREFCDAKCEAQGPTPRACPICDGPVPLREGPGRPFTYCSDRCKAQARDMVERAHREQRERLRADEAAAEAKVRAEAEARAAAEADGIERRAARQRAAVNALRIAIDDQDPDAPNFLAIGCAAWTAYAGVEWDEG